LLIYYRALTRLWVIVTIMIVLLAIQAALVLSGYQPPRLFAHNLGDLIKHAPDNFVYYFFYGRGARLIVSFTAGIAFYLLRYRIPYSKWLFAAVIGFILIAEHFGQWSNEEQPMSNVFMVVPALYVTIFLGLTKLPTLPMLHKGDYSYGIYLYGWPFSQATKAIFPEQSNDWMFLLLVSLVPILLFAAFSWHVVERPILQLRKKFSFVARQRLGEGGGPTVQPTRAVHALPPIGK
jgi:peptidoglycan/LPS O-acetylase OafA/YrhL